MNNRKNISLIPIYAMVFLTVLVVGLLCDGVLHVMTGGKLLPNRHCIVIDAGHGGEDGGAVSCTGLYESEFNLQIALRLNDLLRLMGYDTKMTRNGDSAVSEIGKTVAARKASDLKARVQIVNTANNPLLISIHQNTFSDGRYSGAQVFYGTSEGSKEVAEAMQSALVSALDPGNNRKAKEAKGVYLMEHIQCAGVLVECGFLSNPEEESKLQLAEYQQKISCVLAVTAINYLTLDSMRSDDIMNPVMRSLYATQDRS